MSACVRLQTRVGGVAYFCNRNENTSARTDVRPPVPLGSQERKLPENTQYSVESRRSEGHREQSHAMRGERRRGADGGWSSATEKAGRARAGCATRTDMRANAMSKNF